MAVITIQLIVTSVNISACYPGFGGKGEESTCAFYSQNDTCSASGGFQCQDRSALELRGRQRVMSGRRANHVLVSSFNNSSERNIGETDSRGGDICFFLFF